MSADNKDGDYKEPRFPIAKEDIGPLIGGVMMVFITLAVIYYVYIGPSPFEQWFALVRASQQTQTQTQPKPARSMMPAEAVSGPGGASSQRLPAGASDGAQTAPEPGSEAPEKAETPQAAPVQPKRAEETAK